MTSIRIPGLAASAFLAFLAAGCADSRPASQSQGGSDTCVFCHGDVGRTGNLPGTDPDLRASPPAAPAGKPATVIGAHQAHLNPPAAGAMRGPLPCTECHVVPTNISHATNPPATPVAFGTLAKTQNSSPTWNPATSGCSATYCHGGFDFSGVRGAAATPIWTGAPITCTGCHGLPPTGHPALTGTVTAATCSGCHPATVKADGTIDIAGGKHMNGLAEFQGGHSDPLWADPTHHGYQASAAGLQTCTCCHVAFGTASGVAGSSCNTCHRRRGHRLADHCTFCHGTAGRTGILAGTDTLLPASPPVGTQGEAAATTVAVGAHQGHLNPATATAVASPVACSVCHPSPLPTDVTHVNGLPTAVAFSGLATARSAAPVYNRGAAPTCSSTYCHGNFTFGAVVGNTTPSPAWTNGAALTCTGCHGLPPTGHPALTGTVTAATCNGCHPATVKADGTIDVAGGKHINGLAEFQGGHLRPALGRPHPPRLPGERRRPPDLHFLPRGLRDRLGGRRQLVQRLPRGHGLADQLHLLSRYRRPRRHPHRHRHAAPRRAAGRDAG